ncbi:rsmH, partial [Symbiodinium sp. KB8]
FHATAMPDFEPPESMSLSLDRLYLQAKQLSERLGRSLDGPGVPRQAAQLLAQMPEEEAKEEEEEKEEEARVGAMVAGVELQQKLLQRLRMLPGEAAQAETLTPDVYKKPSPLKSSSDEARLEDLASEANRLKQQIVDAKKEKDLARSRRQKMENESVRHHTNTAKQIANYHCRLQAMHNTMTADKEEVNALRQNCRKDDRKKQSHQAQVRKLKEEADRCKAHKSKLVSEVQTESDRVSALRAEVKTYEQRLKEALERKVLAEAEVMAAKMAQAVQEEEEKEEEEKEEEEDETRNFTMMTGSDHEQEEDDEEEEEARVLNDLELSYEGLELSSIMPVPAAVRLATGHISQQDKMSKADIPETGFLEREGVEFGRWTRPSPSGNKDWTEEELEAEYGEHLRNLEKVLLELRQEQAEQAEERRCQSRLAALKQKKRQEAAAAAAVAGHRFPWSIGNWLRSEKAEAPTPKVSVVSGFTNFSPYAPDLKNVELARERNAELGAISECSEDAYITALGRLCLQLPLDLKLSRLVWLGAHFGLMADAVVLAVGLGPWSTWSASSGLWSLVLWSVLSSLDSFSMPSPLFMREDGAFGLWRICFSRFQGVSASGVLLGSKFRPPFSGFDTASYSSDAQIIGLVSHK